MLVVDVLVDSMFERNEQFELTLAIDQAFLDRDIVLGNPSKATVTIEETEGEFPHTLFTT